MPNALLTTLLLLLVARSLAHPPPPPPHAFLPALPTPSPPPAHAALRKRATGNDGCMAGYGNCAYAGSPGLCCPDSAVCAVDPVGHAACCPLGAACTGTVAGGAFATQQQPVAGAAASSALPGGFVQGNVESDYATTTTTAAAATAAGAGPQSVLQNPYYPFRVIPTTYADAAACSAAWTGCQTDLARCTSALAAPAAGGSAFAVTISAANYVTVRPGTTMPTAGAARVCSSLCSLACSGLQVAACTAFDAGSEAGRGAGAWGWAAGVGAVVGVVGRLLLV